MDQSEILEVQQLTLAFEKHDTLLVAVDSLNFVLRRGETVALLGESGCGKSLTSLALMRLLPTDMQYGLTSQVLFQEKDLLELPEQMMRQLRGRRLAMIFQEPMTALNPVLTIGCQLAEALPKDLALSKKALREKMAGLLGEVEISEPARRLDQYPHQLSGGQKQRVVIAMALARNPDILIADEPTTALDATTQAQILMLLKRLQAKYQMSIVLITHDLAVVGKMANHVYVMYAGQMVESSKVDSFITEPMHPYAQQLLVSLPSFAKRGERLQAIPGCVPTLDARPSGCRFHPRCAHAFELCRTKEPLLQTLSDGRAVRCHLFPDHASLPPLVEVNEPWTIKPFAPELIMSVRDLAIYFYPPRQLFCRRGHPFKAVDGLSFELYKGKTLALVGGSGCGKSTVCKAILRLLSVTRGGIYYRNKDIETLHGRPLREFRKKVQIIFQDPFLSLNPRMTIADILAEGMLAQGVRGKALRTRQLALLSQVNLAENCLHRYPHQFSGGQRQRICIARALATDPEILICDEPTSALDISVQAQILNLLKSLQYELGLTYLFVTHNMSVVSYIADDVLVMRDGVAVESGSCEQVLTRPKEKYTALLCSE